VPRNAIFAEAPSHSGAYRPFDRENSMRVLRYRSVLELERAAVITTRFIMLVP